MKPLSLKIVLSLVLCCAWSAAQAGDLLEHIGLSTPVRGSGKLQTENRTLGDFDAIVIDSSADVSISVGGAYAVSVTIDDNLLPLVETEVRDHRLVIGARGSYSTRKGPKITVQLPALQALTLEGSGDCRVTGLNGGSLKLEIDGSGDIVADGNVDALDAIIEGSGDIDASGLEAADASARIDGSGDARLQARDRLVAKINGSGDIVYHGEPASLRTQISGSGSVRKF